MIFHACLSAPKHNQSLFKGRDLSFWYPRLYPHLNWLTPSPISPDALLAVWNTVQLTQLDDFEGWFAGLSLPPLLPGHWLALKDRSLFLTRASSLAAQPASPVLEHTLLPPFETMQPLPAEPLRSLQNHLDIDRAILTMQVRHYAERGVELTDPAQIYIEGLPRIGTGTRLHSGTVIEGDTRIGEQVLISPHVHLVNARIDHGARILTGSLIYDTHVSAGAQIGPYAHLRVGTVIEEEAKIGNFVEVKKSRIGRKSKAMHLTYLGDATVGEAVNIGAGTITCNYDGSQKHPTIIEDRSFVGSGTELVAPVTLEADSYVAAGSTITDTVPRGSLAIARIRQRIIPDWASRRRKNPKD